MYQNYQIVTVCPAGRRRYMEVLLPYLLANRNIIDRHEFWVNTDDAEDRAWLQETAASHDFIEIVDHAGYPSSAHKLASYYRRTCDPDTIYLKLDDDIVYMSPGAIEALVEFRVDNPEYFLVLPCLINNAISTHMLQRQGLLSYQNGIVSYDSFCPLGWANPYFAATVHQEFLAHLAQSGVQRFQQGRHLLFGYERISINCICYFGRDFQAFGGVVPDEDEQWLTVDKPRELQRPNITL